MAEARQDKQHSVWPSLIKNLARRVVNGLIDWLLGLAVAALLAAAFFLKANWRIVVASVMVCLALSILALARWTRHAADRAHSRTPSNQQLITWYWITIGIQLASLLPGVVAVYFLGRRALPLWLFLGLFVISTLPLTRFGASAIPISRSVQASHRLCLFLPSVI
jgi:hypothetical protein